MNNADVKNQLRRLMHDEGLTIEQAAKCLELDFDAASLAMYAEENKSKPVSVGELVEQFKPEAINILMEIARGYGEEVRAADRVKACQILLEGKGVMPEINASAASRLYEKFEQMKRVTGIIDAAPALEMSFGK